MIIARLFGGLGNQLFIYAFNRALSIKYNQELRFDIHTGFKRDQYKRDNALINFECKINKSNAYNSYYFPIKKRFPNLIDYFYRNSFYLAENNIDSLNNIKLEEKFTYYTEGYWQASEYFIEITDIIKSDLRIKHKFKSNKFSNIFLNSEIETVAIHFRRSNYEKLLDLNYYSAAIKFFKSKLNNIRFVIFSDDYEWATKNIRFNNDEVIFVRSSSYIEDFKIMMNCKHFILSNSTFAWWASFLSEFKNKIIVSPSKDFWPDHRLLLKDMITIS